MSYYGANKHANWESWRSFAWSNGWNSQAGPTRLEKEWWWDQSGGNGGNGASNGGWHDEQQSWYAKRSTPREAAQKDGHAATPAGIPAEVRPEGGRTRWNGEDGHAATPAGIPAEVRPEGGRTRWNGEDGHAATPAGIPAEVRPEGGRTRWNGEELPFGLLALPAAKVPLRRANPTTPAVELVEEAEEAAGKAVDATQPQDRPAASSRAGLYSAALRLCARCPGKELNALKWLEDFEDDPEVTPTVADYLAALCACEATGQPLERVWTLLVDMRKKGIDLDTPSEDLLTEDSWEVLERHAQTWLRQAPHPRALPAVLRLGSLLKRRGRPEEEVVRRAVRTVFEELRDARSPLVADLGAFTGEALRFIGIHTVGETEKCPWHMLAKGELHRQAMLRRWVAWNKPEGPGDLAWLAYDLTCGQGDRLHSDGEVVCRAPKNAAEEFSLLDQGNRFSAEQRALSTLAKKLLSRLADDSSQCLKVNGVLMLCTPSPPETSSICAMQQFLQLFPWVEMHLAFGDPVDLSRAGEIHRIGCKDQDRGKHVNGTCNGRS
ncbi:unnamed protein product [Effrenium voratum]|nr:unnamed protein product [Effrenium voratum]